MPYVVNIIGINKDSIKICLWILVAATPIASILSVGLDFGMFLKLVDGTRGNAAQKNIPENVGHLENWLHHQ